MTLGQTLKAGRLEACLLQKEAAKKTGLTVQSISNHEKDKQSPSVGSLRKYAKAYGLKASNLIILKYAKN